MLTEVAARGHKAAAMRELRRRHDARVPVTKRQPSASGAAAPIVPAPKPTTYAEIKGGAPCRRSPQQEAEYAQYRQQLRAKGQSPKAVLFAMLEDKWLYCEDGVVMVKALLRFCCVSSLDGR